MRVFILLLIIFIFDFRCPWRSLLDIPCPGCGLTRAFISLLRGEFYISFSYHALLIPVLVLVAFLAFEDCYSLNKYRKELIFFVFGLIVFAYYLFRIYNKTIYLL
ncbi:DUF2752 domain-containing protein [uncultured Phascolarctobacterium sp.]|uniref:DUF2752 domain-containing protein n=1 Tax=uncultured Phascolarctobacterium sp. TaxID=512296 RepID=UPI0035A57954